MKPTEEHKAEVRRSLSGPEARPRPSEPQQPRNSVTPGPAPKPSSSHSKGSSDGPTQGPSDPSRDQRPALAHRPEMMRSLPPPLRRVGGPAQKELSRHSGSGETTPGQDEAVARLVALFPGISNETIKEVTKIFAPSSVSAPSRELPDAFNLPPPVLPGAAQAPSPLPPTPLVHPVSGAFPREEQRLPLPYQRSILDVLNLPGRKRYSPFSFLI